MSPESLSDCSYFKESDVYSFAVLMYELMTGLDFIDKTGF